MTQKPKKGDFRKLKSKKNSHWGMLPDPPKSLRVRRSFGKSVSINPRSAPASRFCSCSFIRNLIKQRRFWVMHVNRNWILYPFKMPWWYQIFCSLVSFLSKKRFAEKKMVKYAPQDCKNATSGWSVWLKKHPMCLRGPDCKYRESADSCKIS